LEFVPKFLGTLISVVNTTEATVILHENLSTFITVGPLKDKYKNLAVKL